MSEQAPEPGTREAILRGLWQKIEERRPQWAPIVGYSGAESVRHPVQAFIEAYDVQVSQLADKDAVIGVANAFAQQLGIKNGRVVWSGDYDDIDDQHLRQ